MTPFGFCFGEGWRKMCCGGKAEMNLRKSVSAASTVTILFLLLKRFHAEPSRLGCNFGDALCFPLWRFCCSVSSVQLSRATQMCSAWRETNPADCFIFEVQLSVERSEGQGLDLPWETTSLCQPTTCSGQTFAWSTGSLVSKKTGFQSQSQKSYCHLHRRFKNILTSSRANTSKIPPTHNSPCPSTTSHSELKLYVLPRSIRCRPILAEVPMSPTTEAGSGEKSTWEKTHHPFCWSGHEQTARFHCRGNPFLFQLSGRWNLHTLWIRDGDSKQNILSHELRGINILAETRRKRLPGSLWHLENLKVRKKEGKTGRTPAFGREIPSITMYRNHRFSRIKGVAILLPINDGRFSKTEFQPCQNPMECPSLCVQSLIPPAFFQ